ncbi:DUF4292 domain-containing protein [Salisaeta longa]|uniref:DUF4292 domain-containing protein n=1 Tax=Salisaeta longa TaxID=503170 RepID=UPI0004278840|nr:DUF4292 domain-containing protein [Salisaeta longa]
MLRPLRWLLVLCVSTLLLLACSGPREARAPRPASFPNHTTAQIHQRVAAGTDSLRTLQAEARVRIDAPARDGSFTARIRQDRADSLYMSLHAFLGIEAGRMLLTPDSFYVYNRLDNQLLYGTVQEAQSFLPVPVATRALFANMTGLLAPPAGGGWTTAVGPDSLNYVITAPSGCCTYTVDPTRWRVLRYVERSADGAIVEERRFGDFATVGGVVVPQSITFRRPADGTRAQIAYKEMRFNTALPPFRLTVDGDVQRLSYPFSAVDE